jgi:hypothetical protein
MDVSTEGKVREMTVVRINPGDVFAIELVRLNAPDFRKSLDEHDSRFLSLDGVAGVAGVEAGFQWYGSGELAWDCLEVAGLDDDGEYIYLLEDAVRIEQGELEHVERTLLRVIGDRMRRAITAAEARWAEQWTDLS